MLRKDFSIDSRRKSPDGLINATGVTNHCEVSGHDPFHWQLLHLVYVRSGDSQFGQKLIGVSYGRIAIDDLYRSTALDRSAMEQTFRRRHRQQRLNFSPAAGLPEDHDRARIATEFCDIGLNPLQGMHDIQHPGIAGSREVRAECAEIGKTKHVEPMIDADHHNVAAPREIGSIRVRRRTGTCGESAAMTPEHDGTFSTVV